MKVYDSLRTGELSITGQEAIAAMVTCSKQAITVIFPDTQQQDDTASCGLFALAYAYTLCDEEDPNAIVYNSSQLRQHFLSCIEANKISSFPGRYKTVTAESEPLRDAFRIYCTCRLPDNGMDMIACTECEEKYHVICVELVSPELNGWRCQKCKL